MYKRELPFTSRSSHLHAGAPIYHCKKVIITSDVYVHFCQYFSAKSTIRGILEHFAGRERTYSMCQAGYIVVGRHCMADYEKQYSIEQKSRRLECLGSTLLLYLELEIVIVQP
jgi:hypothetical protein